MATSRTVRQRYDGWVNKRTDTNRASTLENTGLLENGEGGGEITVYVSVLYSFELLMVIGNQFV